MPQDLLYEEDIMRNAYSLKYWWRYIEAKRRARAVADDVMWFGSG